MRLPALFSSHGSLLRAWWLLPLAVLALSAGVGWGMWLIYQEREQRYHHQIEVGLSTINQMQNMGVADWRQRRVGEAAALTDDSLFAQAVHRWRMAGAAGAPGLEAPVHERLRSLVEHTQYTAAYLTDMEGRLLQGAPQAPVAALPAPEQEALRGAFASARPAVVGLRREEGFAFPFFSLLAPLFDGSEPVGAVWLVVDARTTLYPLLEVWPNNSRTAESLLVERQGGDIIFLSPLRHRRDAPLTLRLPVGHMGNAAVALAVAGGRGTLYGADYQGHQVLATASAVPDSDWLLISKIDTAEAFTDAQRREWLALGLLIALGLLSAVAISLLWQRRAWRSERSLKQKLERNIHWLEAAQKAASMGYFAYDAGLREFSMSRMGRAIFGLPRDGRVPLRQWVELLHPQDKEQTLALHGHALAKRLALRTQYRIHRADDRQERWIEVWGECSGADGPKRARITGTVQDITDRKRAEAQLERYRTALEAQVRIDPLTQVSNRLALGEAVTQEWARALRGGTPLGLLMVDVDHFKPFNDYYGHMAGDRCLQSVARALTSVLGRAGDVVARFGGEEFAVLLPGADEAQAGAVAERLCAAVRALSVEHAHGGEGGIVTVSIGVASLCPAELGPEAGEPRAGVDVAQALFQQADAALYRAKQRGRDRAEIYGPDCVDTLHGPPDSLYPSLQ
ncbi:MAG: diguanylate cyclase [Acidovorax sp.]